jgi:hypothetical protein
VLQLLHQTPKLAKTTSKERKESFTYPQQGTKWEKIGGFQRRENGNTQTAFFNSAFSSRF